MATVSSLRVNEQKKKGESGLHEVGPGTVIDIGPGLGLCTPGVNRRARGTGSTERGQGTQDSFALAQKDVFGAPRGTMASCDTTNERGLIT